MRVRGIVISSVDFKEKDKLITIYSLERGIINAKLVGVKNPNAKLKFVKEIFCFADFDLVNLGMDFFVIKTAEIIENFYNIINDLEKFYSGCTILQILKVIGKIGESNEILFIETLKALQILAYDEIESKIVLIKFLVKIFEAMGYQLSLEKCSSCGQNFIGKRYFEYSAGEITCVGCKGPNAEVIDPLTHSILRIISLTDYQKLKSLKLKKEGLNSALNLLFKNFSRRFDCILSIADKF